MSRADAILRLRSARGHLDGVIRMLEERRYCPDVLYQINAVERALEHSKRAILDEHLRVCVRDTARGVHTDDFVDELLDAIYGGRSPGTARYCADTGATTSATPHSATGSTDDGLDDDAA